MKPFIFLLWHHLLNFPANASSITFLLLMPILITVFNHKPHLPARFFSFYIAVIDLIDGSHKMATTPKGWDVNCVYYYTGKVLIFFIVHYNNNSISFTRSAQFEDITLIKKLIKFTSPNQLLLTCPRGMIWITFCAFLAFGKLKLPTKEVHRKTQFISTKEKSVT